jgi:hypothetical protein
MVILLFGNHFCLLFSFFLIILNNLLLLLSLLQLSLLIDQNGILVGFNNLMIDLLLNLFLFLNYSHTHLILDLVLFLELFSSPQQLLGLSFLLFLLFQSFNFALFNLFDDDLMTTYYLLFLPFFFFLVMFDLLKPFHFHDQILLFFLCFKVFPNVFLLIELPISNSDGFSVRHHFIHLFDVF